MSLDFSLHQTEIVCFWVLPSQKACIRYRSLARYGGQQITADGIRLVYVIYLNHLPTWWKAPADIDTEF